MDRKGRLALHQIVGENKPSFKQWRKDFCTHLALYLIPYYWIVKQEIQKENKEIEERNSQRKKGSPTMEKPIKSPSFRGFTGALGNDRNSHKWPWLLCRGMVEAYHDEANMNGHYPFIKVECHGTVYNIRGDIQAIARVYSKAMSLKATP